MSAAATRRGGARPRDALPPPSGRAVLRLDSRGKVIVTLAAPPQGQGYQTAFAQIAADALGVRLEDVEVVTGDTARATSTT